MWLVQSRRQLDSDTFHQLWWRPTHSKCYLIMAGRLRTHCLANGALLLGNHARYFPDQRIRVKVLGFHQQAVHLLDWRERYHYPHHLAHNGRHETKWRIRIRSL